MRFKIDENLGGWLARMLTDRGHDASTVREQGLAGAADADLISICRAEARCLVTLDVEFGNPLRFPPRAYAGIVVLRPPAPITMAQLQLAGSTFIDAIAREIASEPSTSLAGKLWIVEPGRIRQYQPQDEPPPST